MKKEHRIDIVKIIFPFLGTLGAVIVLVFGFIIPLSKEVHFRRQKEFIEQYTEVTVSILKNHLEMVEKGILTLKESKVQAKVHIQNLRHGKDEKNYFWIIDTHHTVIMHPYRLDLVGSNVFDYTDPEGTYLFQEMVTLAEEKGEGYVSYYWQFKDEPEIIEEKLSFIKLFEPWGWILGTGLYLEETFEEIAEVIRSITIISVLVILVILGLTVYMLRQGFIITKTKHELVDRLFESENKYKILVEFMNEGIMIITSEGRISYVNDKLASMLSYTRTEIEGADVYRFLDKKNRAVLRKQLERRKTGSEQPYELNWQTKQGKSLATIVSPKPVKGRDGTFRGSFSVITDISRQKSTEKQLQSVIEQKNSLLREVHHRVKNNLQLISSLLNLQKGKFEDQAIREAWTDSQLRVQTMANVHELLYQNDNFKRIDMKEFVEQISMNLKSVYLTDASPVTISFAIDNVYMQVDQAIPCGLILNELLSNTLKYAFPNASPESEIVVAMKMKDSQVMLRVADNGVGLSKEVSFDSEETLGLKLVFLLSEQLGGSVSVESRNGADFSVVFPFEGE